MTTEELDSKMRNSLFSKTDFDDLYNLMVQFKNEGGSMYNAYTVCEKLHLQLRDDTDETHYNLVLDISDFVVGYCWQAKAIWPDDTFDEAYFKKHYSVAHLFGF